MANGVDLTETSDLVDEITSLAGTRCIAVAESCTAGQVAARVAAAGGADRYLRGGLVSYQERTKRDVLHVRAPSVLSTQAAREMATGVARLLDADLAVATTGVVGDDEVEGTPPGTVYIGTFVDGETRARRWSFEGDPERICAEASRQALCDLRDHLRDRAGR